MRVIFTPLAERHIDALHEYIGLQSSEARADGYVRRIIDFCDGFAIFPERGTRRDDILPGPRVIGFERRVTIAFFVAEDGVLVEGRLLCWTGLRGGFPRTNLDAAMPSPPSITNCCATVTYTPKGCSCWRRGKFGRERGQDQGWRSIGRR